MLPNTCTERTPPASKSRRASSAAGVPARASSRLAKRSWPMPVSERFSSNRARPGVGDGFGVTATG